MKRYSIIFLVFTAQLLTAMDDCGNNTYTTINIDTPLEASEIIQIKRKNQTIQAFTKIIMQYPKLHELDLSQHKIQKFENSQYYMYNLRVLSLNNGPLESCDTIRHILHICPNLTTLSIKHNNLTTLQEINLKYTYAIQELDCSNNKIKTIDFAKIFTHFPYLTNFNASDNPLTSIILETTPIINNKPHISRIRKL